MIITAYIMGPRCYAERSKSPLNAPSLIENVSFLSKLRIKMENKSVFHLF